MGNFGLHESASSCIAHGNLPGTYEARWYGSRRKGKFYEIARGTHTLAEPITT